MKTIKVENVNILDGVYLDFDNGPVFLLQTHPDNIMLVGSDDSYRGEAKDLIAILKQHDNIKFAKTLKGEKITL